MSDLIARLIITLALVGAALAMLILGKEPVAAVGILAMVGGFWFGQYADRPTMLKLEDLTKVEGL